jgi:hypothetical protein
MLTLLLAFQTVLAGPAGPGPFAFFRPSFVVSADDRRQLDAGHPLARALPARNHEVAILAAVPVDIDGDRLVAWMRNVAELKKSSYVLAIQRFSNPPRIEDLVGLTLDDDDLSAIRQCRPAACDLKLAGAEMSQLQSVLAVGGSQGRRAFHDAFRRVILRRVQAYLDNGHDASSNYEDRDPPVSPAATSSLLLQHSAFLSEHLPRFARYLDRYPHAPVQGVESFVYWSKERLGGKAIIRVIHVSMLRGTGEGLPDALVAGKEIFTTRYLNGSVGFTAIVPGGRSSRHYLVYLNRSDVDILGGVFGGMVRWFMERRLRTEAQDVLQGLRRRLESGEPPPLPNRTASLRRHVHD